MSVPLQLRRDTAANIASRAAPVGEVIADLTNMRLTLGDGSTLGNLPQASIRDLAGFNLGINTPGSINQRGVSGTVTLAAGAYGHDRMKAGANGCTYTFTTSANGDTAFNITVGSLIQPIDVGNVFSTAMYLTWTGTALARVYQGAVGSAPALAAGSLVPIPADGVTVNTILQSGLALGTVTFVEFGTGTLNTTRPWQLEVAMPNAGPTRLGRRHGELALCQRYFQIISRVMWSGNVVTQDTYYTTAFLKSTMRSAPTVTLTNIGTTGFSAATVNSVGPDYVEIGATATSTGPANLFITAIFASSEI